MSQSSRPPAPQRARKSSREATEGIHDHWKKREEDDGRKHYGQGRSGAIGVASTVNSQAAPRATHKFAYPMRQAPQSYHQQNGRGINGMEGGRSARSANSGGNGDSREERNKPPPRPPRPAPEDTGPFFDGNNGDFYFGAESTSGTSLSSGGSGGSVIPNFPTPAPQGRRTANSTLRPPPSRPGTNMVSPIPEESSSRKSKYSSYASSAAIPPNWANSPFEDRSYEQEEADYQKNSNFAETGDGSNLVRQASLGRKSKPTLTQINTSMKPRHKSRGSTPHESPKGTTMQRTPKTPSNSSPSKPEPAMVGSQSSSDPSPVLRYPQHSKSASSLSIPDNPRKGSSPLAQEPVDASYFETTERPFVERPSASRHRTKSDTMLNFSMLKELGMKNLKAKEAEIPMSPIASSKTDPEKMGTTANPRLAGLRPPRLNLNAVRDAEARGSLTSLPDLIKRAGRLAGLLEDGRRASSVNRGSYLSRQQSSRTNGNDTDSISDILASFPPPMAGAQKSRDRMSQWPLPSDFQHDEDGSMRSMRERRRICGLAPWAFVLLVILFLLVITAAVVVPLQLVNLSKSDNSKSESALDKCKTSTPCNNGGESILTGGDCGCICTNGYTGSQCDEGGDSSCTTVSLGTSMDNVTIGSALPRLFLKASETFEIDLETTDIIGSFNKANLSCTLQNSLVSFDGHTEPITNGDNESSEKRSLHERQPASATGLTIATSTGSAGSSFSATATTSSATATASSTESSASSTSSAFASLDQDIVDFARVAILYIVQSDSLDSAQTAQDDMNNVFKAGDYGDITLSEITVKLSDMRIETSDGSIIGSSSNSTNSASAIASSSTSNAKFRRRNDSWSQLRRGLPPLHTPRRDTR